MRRHARILGLIGLSVIASPSQAQTYRWVNEQGVTVYSQTPPPSGAATVVPPPPPPPTGAAAPSPIEERLKQIETQKAERRAREAEEAKLRERQARIEANCEAARHNLEVLEGPARRRFADDSGEYQRFTEEERQRRIQEAEDQIKEFCTE